MSASSAAAAPEPSTTTSGLELLHQAAAVAEEEAIPSPNAMLPWLHHDAHTPSLLISLLPLVDVAHLYGTCKSWQKYFFIENSLHLKLCQSQAQLVRTPAQLERTLASPWLPRIARNILIKVDEEKNSGNVESDDPQLRQEVTRATALLAKFECVERLEVSIRLELLSNELFEAIGSCLPKLKSLVIANRYSQMPKEKKWEFSMRLSFKPLTKCKHLSTFLYDVGSVFWFSPAQTLDLISCESMANLNSDESRALPSLQVVQPMIKEIASSQMLPRLRLRRINLVGLSVNTQIWEQLCKLTTLASLVPLQWPSQFGEQWSRLAAFPELNELRYRVDKKDIAQPCKHFWSALLQKSLISTLYLYSVVLSKSDLSDLFRSLPQLKKLVLEDCRLESCDIFSESTVEHLVFKECTDFDGNEFSFHTCLPAMKSLRELQVHQYRNGKNFHIWQQGEKATAEKLSTFKAQLAQRMVNLPLRKINYASAYAIWKRS